MLKVDKVITYFLTERGRFYPLGQALPIQLGPETEQNSRQNSEKEAHVY